MPRSGSRPPSGCASSRRRPPRTTARELSRTPSNGGLESYNKPELVELASSIGIEGRTNMTKAELVDAIAKASRAGR